MITFGHTSEKRIRSQPWLLGIEDCTNLPSEDVVIEGLEELKRGRKMKKLHFRRFFRPTTTTRGGTTAGLPPEHHHMGRRFPRPAAHIEDRSHIGHYIPLTHPSTKLSPTSHFLRPLFLSTHLFQHTPLGHLSGLLEAVPDHPIS